MIELATGFATLSLFLAWRLYVANKRIYIADEMLKAVVRGDVTFTHTKDGVIMEVKEDANV